LQPSGTCEEVWAGAAQERTADNERTSPAVVSTAFPERPIKVIVPFPAGRAVDLIARLVTGRITQDKGQSSVDNPNQLYGFPPL
jgi:tripartite-type tricarboxylate transporter receptor subunit TctC